MIKFFVSISCLIASTYAQDIIHMHFRPISSLSDTEKVEYVRANLREDHFDEVKFIGD